MYTELVWINIVKQFFSISHYEYVGTILFYFRLCGDRLKIA